MSRIVSLGVAAEEVYLIDRDDFGEAEIDGRSVFGDIVIGSQIDIDKIRFDIGGSGANAAVCFARHGHETIFMGSIGHDSAGEAILRRFDEENIDTSYTEFTRGATACSVILLDAKTSNRSVLSYKGTASAKNLNPEDLDNLQPDWLYASSLGGDLGQLSSFFAKAHSLGAKVMFSPGPAELQQKTQLLKLLKEVDVLTLNKREAAELVPGVLLTELLSHLSNYCPAVIITDGVMGAMATDHQTTYRLGVYEQSRVRDPSGVGDAFGAGFLAEYAAGADFRQALIFASANATAVTQKYGAEQGILTGEEPLHQMPIMEVENLAEWIQEQKEENV